MVARGHGRTMPLNKFGIDVGGDYAEVAARDPRFIDSSDHEFVHAGYGHNVFCRDCGMKAGDVAMRETAQDQPANHQPSIPNEDAAP